MRFFVWEEYTSGMTWTKFNSLERGETVRDGNGTPTGYRWAVGNKRSYTKSTLGAAALGLAVVTLIQSFNISFS